MSTLKRHLRLFTLTIYGVGVIVGAGIYVLVGKIVNIAGPAAWAAFLVAAVAALPTGLSYAELTSRYPKAAGEAVFANRAFGRDGLSFLVGYLVLASGVASTAAVAHGFSSYFIDMVGLSAGLHTVVVLSFLVALSWLNHRGIEESAWVSIVCTVISVAALLVLVAAGADSWGSADLTAVPAGEGEGGGASAVLLAGGALAFYAYIGFEDICNVAEEVVRPVRTIPKAILLSLAITTVLYIAVTVTAVSAVPSAELGGSEVPLVLVSERVLPTVPSGWLNLVALFATTNTALFNLIMSSRILYGMAQQDFIPRGFAKVHPKRRTPSWGVGTAFVLAAGFALTGVLEVLAQSTNVIILLAFFAVNSSLIGIKLKRLPADQERGDDAEERGHFEVPTVVPVLGLATTAYMATFFPLGAYLRAGGLIAVGGVLYALQAIMRRRR